MRDTARISKDERRARLAVQAGAVLFAGTILSQAAQAVTLPYPYDPHYAAGIYQVGDFHSYALPVLAALDGLTMNKSPFDIDTSPGKLKNYVVIATGSGGEADDNSDLGNGFNDAYATPNSSGITDFSTFNAPGIGYTADPGGGNVTGDDANHWDADIAALSSYLNGQKALFVFNHNQTKSNGGNDEDLWAWGQVVLTNSTGTQTMILDLTLNDDKGLDPVTSYANTRGLMQSGATPFPNPYDPALAGAFPYGLPDLSDTSTSNDLGDWIHSPGEIDLGGKTIEMNLGEENAAYALYSPELQAILDAPNHMGYTHMQVTVRLTGLNNGFEQIFIMGGDVAVPLPATVWMGGALLGLVCGYHGIRRFAMSS